LLRRGEMARYWLLGEEDIRLLGFRFAPRIRDLSDHRMFCFERPSQYEGFQPLLGGRIHAGTIREHWDDVAWLISSLRQATVSPSLLVSKLAGHPRQNHLFIALREIGRIEWSFPPGSVGVLPLFLESVGPPLHFITDAGA
jgi:TnpA family transposase